MDIFSFKKTSLRNLGLRNISRLPPQTRLQVSAYAERELSTENYLGGKERKSYMSADTAVGFPIPYNACWGLHTLYQILISVGMWNSKFLPSSMLTFGQW